MTPISISLEQHTKEVTALQNEITYLKEQLDWFKKQLFGQKAEKFVDTCSDQQLYFEGFDRIAPIPLWKKKNRLKAMRDVRESLPVKIQSLFLQIFQLKGIL